MTTPSEPQGLQFLSVDQAAELLGVSRIKVREAAARNLIPFKRDNENCLRLDLSDMERIKLDKKGKRLSQAALMHVLFDEVEELHDILNARDGEVAALRDIAERQANALEAAADQIEQDAAHKQRLQGLLERALMHLEAAQTSADERRLAEISDRALTTLETTGDQLEASMSTIARFDALVARAVDLAAASQQAGAAESEAMAATAERAMQMLDVALGEAEGNRQNAQKTGQMLERALSQGERLEQQIALRDRELETKNAAMDKVLEMSERAVALAATDTQAPRKRSFWQWLTGK